MIDVRPWCQLSTLEESIQITEAIFEFTKLGHIYIVFATTSLKRAPSALAPSSKSPPITGPPALSTVALYYHLIRSLPAASLFSAPFLVPPFEQIFSLHIATYSFQPLPPHHQPLLHTTNSTYGYSLYVPLSAPPPWALDQCIQRLPTVPFASVPTNSL